MSVLVFGCTRNDAGKNADHFSYLSDWDQESRDFRTFFFQCLLKGDAQAIFGEKNSAMTFTGDLVAYAVSWLRRGLSSYSSYDFASYIVFNNTFYFCMINDVIFDLKKKVDDQYLTQIIYVNICSAI